jgi:hypothetical protein
VAVIASVSEAIQYRGCFVWIASALSRLAMTASFALCSLLFAICLVIASPQGEAIHYRGCFVWIASVLSRLAMTAFFAIC